MMEERGEETAVSSTSAAAAATTGEQAMMEPISINSELQRVAAIVESLISASHSAKYFVGKWQLIRNKLDYLSSALTSATTAASNDAPVLRELLQAVSTSVAETHLLVSGCCGDESVAGGKLLMRSNLDLAAARFDAHGRSLAGVYASGVLTHASAIVASKPGSGATRDDMRFYVRDLFSRLKVGDGEVKARALAALVEVLREDERYVRIVAVETQGIVGLLVSFLESGEAGVQEEAAEAVLAIAGVDSGRAGLAMSGAVAALVRVVETGSDVGKERAARALKKLTENGGNAWSVSSHGGVTALLRLCSAAGSGKAELVAAACGALRNLVGVVEIRRYMVEEGGAVAVFLRMLRSWKEEALQLHAIEFLHAISAEDAEAKKAVVRGGVVESLVRILDPNSPSSSKTREIALRAIESLCFSSPNTITVLLNSGFIDTLLLLLQRAGGEGAVQEAALQAAARLCGSSEEARRAMGEAGFMAELARLLEEAGTGEGREAAARALAGVVAVQRNQRRFVQEERNVGKVIQALGRKDERPATRRLLLSTLVAVTESSTGRRRIANSGYVKELERMAESEGAADARRVVRKVAGNRFKNLLHGIWS